MTGTFCLEWETVGAASGLLEAPVSPAVEDATNEVWDLPLRRTVAAHWSARSRLAERERPRPGLERTYALGARARRAPHAG